MAKIEFGKGFKDKLQGAVKSTKEAVESVELPTKKEKHTIVQLSGSKIRILIPDGYERLKHKNVFKGIANSLANSDAGFQKTVSTSNNIVLVYKTTPDKAMNPDDVQGLITGIHENLSESQGIIEVSNGETKRGYKYIYSIVKTLCEPSGVKYYLRLNLFHEQEVVEVQAEFTEINMTGMRESTCVDLARRAGLVDVFNDGFEGWSCDPYDPNYTKGKLKNLAEKEGLDGLFPENPLSQAHEFLYAVLRDEFTTVREDSPKGQSAVEDEQKSSDDSKTAEEKAEKELFLGLFVDECRRHTKPIEVDVPKNTESADVKPPKGKAAKQLKEDKKEDPLNITAISTKNAIKIVYYLMAADGEIFHSEEEKFDSIGKELDPKFSENREQIIRECQAQLDKAIDPEDYYDTLQDGVEEALLRSKETADTFITPKLLVWDLLTVAYSDESYDETERRLIKYIVRKTNIDKAVFMEMESSILTLMDIEKELAWIKTTNRPYLVIEAMVNELADRKNVIFESVKDLISL